MSEWQHAEWCPAVDHSPDPEPPDESACQCRWRHVYGSPEPERLGRCVVGIVQRYPGCGCTTPTPDPSSPCGTIRFGLPCGFRSEDHTPTGHPHVPTRCECGHPITKE